ncbi:mas-related G-protein coupled receptor member H-like [Paroedura picta]|uniref:mas-related G-protein coupled receptor member H-like n=1 Tax=Paroedura picta TaxID=143630 RepID=UPI004057C477
MAARTNTTTLSEMNATREHLIEPNYTYANYDNNSISYNPSDNGPQVWFKDIFVQLIPVAFLLTSTFGALGNGAVIWLLGFCIKRNPFMTYILNLAVADFGVVILVILYIIYFLIDKDFVESMLIRLIFCMFSASQFLLTAISIDRCVALFFPFWYRYKRPPCLTTVVCAVLWVLSVLLTAVSITLLFLKGYDSNGHIYQFMANIILCLPFMTIAFVSLTIKACLKAQQHRRGKLLTTVLLILFFFLLFAFPYNVISTLSLDGDLAKYMVSSASLLATLNSCVNPVIYFLVGRESKSTQRESMTMILLKVFTEEDDCAEEAPAETSAAVMEAPSWKP